MVDAWSALVSFGLSIATLLGVTAAGSIAVTLLAKLLKRIERAE